MHALSNSLSFDHPTEVNVWLRQLAATAVSAVHPDTLLSAGQLAGYDATKRAGRQLAGVTDGPGLQACAACGRERAVQSGDASSSKIDGRFTGT